MEKEDLKIVNLRMHNKQGSRYVKQKLRELKGEKGKSPNKAGDFNALAQDLEDSQTKENQQESKTWEKH